MAILRPVIRANDEVLSMPQAARELGVSRYTAYVWAVSGRLPAREIAGRYVVRRVDLDEFRAAHVV